MASSKKIVPFTPSRHFPSRLNQNAFAAELQRAKRSLKKYAERLAHFSPPLKFLTLLLPLEAVASLSSQKIRCSLKQALAPSLVSRKQKNKLNPIIQYTQALQWICKHRPSINKTTICTLHKKIKRDSSAKADVGCLRKKQNWIGPMGCKMDEAYFYPPAPKFVPGLMQNLFDYCRVQEEDPLVQLSLFFAQLLIIHPFMDGNGRIARLLIPLFLYQKKQIPLPFFFMSRYFKRHRVRYFQTLYLTTEKNQWEGWIQFFLKGISIEAKKIQLLLEKIERLYVELQKEALPQKILDSLFLHPVFLKTSLRSKALFKKLQRLKWITQDKRGVCHFTKLLKLLQASLK